MDKRIEEAAEHYTWVAFEANWLTHGPHADPTWEAFDAWLVSLIMLDDS